VLGTITTELGRAGVSVEQMVQEGRGTDEQGVPVLLITHRSPEGAIHRALEAIAQADFMTRPPRLLRIEEI
jgi:hypothetical protein